MPVHEFGLACDIEKVCAIAARHGLPVIEDAACALGARQNGKPVGGFGTLGSFSLHPRKSITSGEGGVIVTNNDEFSIKLRQLRNHGIEMEKGKMNFVEAGFNYRMTDFQAALAYSQFLRLESILDYKNELAEIYNANIKNSRVTLPYMLHDRNHTWQTYHLLIDEALDQEKLIARLKEVGIGTNYGAQCIPYQTYYKSKYKLDSATLFPNAYRAYSKGLAIPIYDQLSKDDLDYIIQTINQL
jgi:dTDP-4-amino-4,6-dideoxygalactose transaminase